MSGWKVADPSIAAVAGIRVQEVHVEYFSDDTSAIEQIADRALTSPELRAAPVILVTPSGFLAMGQISRTAHLLGPRNLANMLQGLAAERRLVCLRWAE